MEDGIGHVSYFQCKYDIDFSMNNQLFYGTYGTNKPIAYMGGYVTSSPKPGMAEQGDTDPCGY